MHGTILSAEYCQNVPSVTMEWLKYGYIRDEGCTIIPTAEQKIMRLRVDESCTSTTEKLKAELDVLGFVRHKQIYGHQDACMDISGCA